LLCTITVQYFKLQQLPQTPQFDVRVARRKEIKETDGKRGTEEEEW